MSKCTLATVTCLENNKTINFKYLTIKKLRTQSILVIVESEI